MKKTITTTSGRIFDCYFHYDGGALLWVTAYEVKHPQHKKFFRINHEPFCEGLKFVSDYKTIEDCLLAVLAVGLKNEKNA